MARPTFTPTDAQRENVKILSACGVPQSTMCQIIVGKNDPIDEKTLRKHFKVELESGAALANAKVAQSLFKKATGGNVTAQLFWLKTRAGWKETQNLEVTGKNGGAIETTQKVNVADMTPAQIKALVESLGDEKENDTET
jgi:hypothetical protein